MCYSNNCQYEIYGGPDWGECHRPSGRPCPDMVEEVVDDSRKCPSCNGTGRFLRFLRDDGTPVYICTECKGTGTVEEE